MLGQQVVHTMTEVGGGMGGRRLAEESKGTA